MHEKVTNMYVPNMYSDYAQYLWEPNYDAFQISPNKAETLLNEKEWK